MLGRCGMFGICKKQADFRQSSTLTSQHARHFASVKRHWLHCWDRRTALEPFVTTCLFYEVGAGSEIGDSVAYLKMQPGGLCVRKTRIHIDPVGKLLKLRIALFPNTES
jgi:hypothetical protein